MNKKAEFKMQNYLLAILFVGLGVLMIGITVSKLNTAYDQDNFDDTILAPYNDSLTEMQALTADAQSSADSVLNTTVDSNAFDVFGQYYRNGITGARIFLASMGLGLDIGNGVIDGIGVFPEFKTFLALAIVVVLIIGFLIIRVFLKPSS